MLSNVENCIGVWEELEREYQELEEKHRDYYKKVEDVKAMQQRILSGIAHQRYQMKNILDASKRLERKADQHGNEQLSQLSKQIFERKRNFRELEEVLPHENGIYLKIILGSVNVSLLSKRDKYRYKEDYENFKLYITMISMVLACLLWFVNFRVTDAAFQFLLVWYYCTLTIREHILKVNGSRIKGWWIAHHFISTVCAGILLIWPEGAAYTAFRRQFVYFSMYLSLVQVTQYYYQKGCLYRLRALGESHNMDITVEGFQSWMWKGLTFVLPFLIGGYLFQLYNAYVLYYLSKDPSCIEWQVSALAAIFFILFLGNSLTTVNVVRQKLFTKWKTVALTNKYRFQISNAYTTKEKNTATTTLAANHTGENGRKSKRMTY